MRHGTFSVEPLDPARDPLERLPGGLARVRYRFQTQWSPPERLIAAVAPRFPALCFVLGYVEPNMDMAGSLLFGRGETRAYELGARRKEAI